MKKYMIDLSEVLTKGKSIEIEVEDHIDLSNVLLSKEGIRVDLVASVVAAPMANGASLTLNVKGVARGTCSRCMEEAQVEFEQEARLIAAKNPGALEEDVLQIVDNKVDIFQPVVETILLSMPMVLICSDQCKGLCPICGANLNFESCRCEELRTPVKGEGNGTTEKKAL